MSKSTPTPEAAEKSRQLKQRWRRLGEPLGRFNVVSDFALWAPKVILEVVIPIRFPFDDGRRALVAEHNAGKVPHTSKFTPWTIRSATASKSRERAIAFEHYLKSGSGRAFLQRHL
jgi:putative endonuclease